MSYVSDLIGGAVGTFGAVATVGLTYQGLKYAKKRNAKEDIEDATKEAVADAVALSGAIIDIKWIKEQLGKNPNGGGAMEQLLTHAKNQAVMITTINDSLSKHLSWHIESAN